MDTPNPAYIFKEEGAILSWQEINEIEGFYSLNDTLGDISASEAGKVLLDTEVLPRIPERKGPLGDDKESDTMKKILDMGDQFDTTWPAHCDTPVGKDVLQRIYDLAQGIIDGMCAASVAQAPGRMAELGVNAMYEYIVNGTQPEAIVDTGCSMVTAENAEEYLTWH